MLFLKPKPKLDEILPPPPPFPTMELGEPKVTKGSARDLIEISKVQKKSKEIKEKTSQKKSLKAKKQAAKKSEIEQIKMMFKQIGKKKSLKKAKKDQIKKVKIKKKPSGIASDKNFGEELDFELPEELKKSTKEEVELPDTLEELDVEKENFEVNDFDKDLSQEITKPREVAEAEEEIKRAIETIKSQEKSSFFGRFFSRKEKMKEESTEEHLMPELPEIDDISIIKNKINKAREALMKFDLETAKKNYVEIISIYNRINPEAQAKVYHEIKDLYFERKSGEELKV